LKKRRRPLKRPRPYRRRIPRDWGTLNERAIKLLVTAAAPRWGGMIAPSTMMRALGMKVPAVLLNPRRQTNGRKQPMSRRRRNPEQLGLLASERKGPGGHGSLAGGGDFHGPYPAGSHVKMGRRARGRGRAKVYGPVKSASAYRAIGGPPPLSVALDSIRRAPGER